MNDWHIKQSPMLTLPGLGGGSNSASFITASGLEYGPLDILGDGSCLARYKLDGDVTDESGNYNGSSASNIGWTVDGLSGKCMDCGGNSQFTVPNIKDSYPLSVSMWIRNDISWDINSGAMDELFNMSINGQRLSLGFVNNSGWVLGVTIMYGGTHHWAGHTRNSIHRLGGASKSALSEDLLGSDFSTGSDAWYHIVYSIAGNNDANHRVWINGCQIGLKNEGGGHGGSAGWRIGANAANGEYWNGQIENVRFFNKTLSDAEAWKLTQEFYTGGVKPSTDIVKDQLRLHYDFSESSCYSGSGQVNNLAADVAPNWKADVNGATFGGSGTGKYFEFDGSNDRLEVGSAAGETAGSQMGDKAYTLEAWIYIAGISNIGGIISCQWDDSTSRGASICTDSRNAHGSGGANGYHHQFSKNGSWTTGGDGNTAAGTGGISNRWDHVVATFDGEYKRVWENGISLGHQGQHTFDHDDYVDYGGGTYWAIGCQSEGSSFNTRYFNGKIAIVRIYDIALSGSQILHNYNAEKSRFGL